MSDLRTVVATVLSRTGICVRADIDDLGTIHVHLSSTQATYLAKDNRLVVRADLEKAIVDRTAAGNPDGKYGRAAICYWPGCNFFETCQDGESWSSLRPHSPCCPLGEPAA